MSILTFIIWISGCSIIQQDLKQQYEGRPDLQPIMITVMDVNFDMPLCIVIGSEGEGVSKNMLSVGKNITLPQKTSDISYNASVAAGILLFLIGNKCGKIG